MGREKRIEPGERFCRLTVIKRVDNDKYQNAQYLCMCDCGKKTISLGSNLRSGHKRSCGCLQRDTASAMFKTHGLSKTKIMKTYFSMRQRCYNKNSSAYHDYGGRGIVICEEWQDSKNFYDWAIKNGYKDGLTIERIDNDKDYCPQNCRWATKTEQNRNTRRTHRILFGGKVITAAQAGRIVGVDRSSVAKWCREGKVKTIDDVYELKERRRIS